jgi:hypothetical protein
MRAGRPSQKRGGRLRDGDRRRRSTGMTMKIHRN